MQKTELDTIMHKLCGEELGAASRFARMLGTTPATISRWRDGTTPVRPRDEKLLRLLYSLNGKLNWQTLVEKPVSNLDELL